MLIAFFGGQHVGVVPEHGPVSSQNRQRDGVEPHSEVGLVEQIRALCQEGHGDLLPGRPVSSVD